MSDAFDLTGKVVLATGGNSGIGRACLTERARQGADFVIWDRNGDRHEDALDILRAVGAPRFHAQTVDVSQEQEVERAFAVPMVAMGRVDHRHRQPLNLQRHTGYGTLRRREGGARCHGERPRGQVGQFGVRANMIAPGFILSGMAQAGPQTDQVSERLSSITPLGRPRELSNIEGPAAYLASDAFRFQTGDTSSSMGAPSEVALMLRPRQSLSRGRS